MRNALYSLALFSLAMSLVACNGIIGDPSGMRGTDVPDGSVDGGGIDGGTPGVCEDDVCLGRSGMPRLTRTQYLYSVRQLFGATVTVDVDRLPADHEAGPFSSNEAVLTTGLDVDLYAEMARSVAQQVVDGDRAFLPCDPADALACAADLVRTITPIAYRRPLSADEESAYVDLLSWVLEQDGFDTALATYVETVLQSPHFVYRIEPAATDEPTRLDGYAVATRLSHFLFREGPDATLIAAAEAGELDTPEGVMAHAATMVDDPRADRTISEFHREWLGVGHLEDVSRLDDALTEEVRDDMRRETERFALEALREDDGTLGTLLTGRWSMLNPRLSGYYGVDGPESGWARTDMGERAGILTTGGVMTAHGSETFTQPVHRGLFVRTRVLCHELRPAPAGAIDEANEAAEELPEDMSDRERLAAITENGVCASCHSLMNSIGYGFEAFDPIGRFRMRDSTGAMLDINGAIEGWDEYETDVDGTFVGAHELGERLAESADVARCVSRQWFRYGTQRAESPEDEAAIEMVYQAFAASGHQIRAAMVAVTGTDAFLYRAPRLSE